MKRFIQLGVACLALTLTSTGFVPTTAQAERIKVLVLGDSVASVLRWSPPTMKAFWKGPFDVTLEVWGCQKLVDPGCIEGNVAQPSALQLIRKHRGKGFDIVVVATGYNDTGAEYLRKSIRKVNTEVRRQNADLMWLTYRENGNVKIKARAFNKVVKAEAKRLKFAVMDWATISQKQKHWFTGDSVHMNAHGGIRLGNHLRRALDAHIASPSKSTTTTTTTTTVAPAPLSNG